MLRYDWFQQDAHTILHWCGTLIPKQLTMTVALRNAELKWRRDYPVGADFTKGSNAFPRIVDLLWDYVRCKDVDWVKVAALGAEEWLDDERFAWDLRRSMQALIGIVSDPARVIHAPINDPVMVRRMIPFEAVRNGRITAADPPNPGLDHWAWIPFAGHRMKDRKLIEQSYAFTGADLTDLMMETKGRRILSTKTIRGVLSDGTDQEKVTIDEFMSIHS